MAAGNGEYASRGVSLGGGAGGGGVIERVKITEKVEVQGVAKEELDQVEQESLKKREELLARHQEEARQLYELQQEVQSKAAATEHQLAERARLLEQQQRTKREIAAQLQLAEERLQMDRETAEQARRDGEALEKRMAEIQDHVRHGLYHILFLCYHSITKMQLVYAQNLN